MYDIEYKVEKTACYPCSWYGGPFFNGIRQTNSTLNYFRTEAEAKAFCVKMRKLNDGKTG